ncbi:succinyl-diaminopimelate desuccinylase [Clostridiales Family XIII bacterium PM5-7]
MSMKTFFHEQKENMINDIVALVNIPSVFNEQDTREKQPFGSDVAKALDWILEKAESMGMQTKNIDGYAGEITIGTGPLMIGILVHEDVVPAGEGWNSEPFNAHVEHNRIYGRGTGDDKGPLISSLYAMKYLMDNDRIPHDACLRMIIGTNEEETWGGINYYKEKVSRLPDYSIVPDGYFPLVFCEKGLLDLNFKFPINQNENGTMMVETIVGGSGRNVVPGKASCTIFCNTDKEKGKVLNLVNGIGLSVEAEGDLFTVTAEGKSTHAMSPEKGSNAISSLIAALEKLDLDGDIGTFVANYMKYIGMDYNGGDFGCGFEDELSGKLTFNIGTINMTAKEIVLEANLRYPASMGKEEVMDALRKTSNLAGFTMEEIDYLPPVYTKPDSDFVNILMEAYQKNTGDQVNGAFAIGGATYARAIPNAVAFGPLFPYEEELAHEANEYLEIDSLEKMTMIYIDALEGLMQLKGE